MVDDPVRVESVVRKADTEYAWKFRYSGELMKPAIGEAEDSLALAREVVAAVLDRLPAEVRP